jgi:hypothetical protein
MNTTLEKFVEAELFNEPVRAYFNGFYAFTGDSYDRKLQRFRQVQLEPYGIADIVTIYHAGPEARDVIIQVIECKRDMVNLATYAQAKRYLAALKKALAGFVAETEALGLPVKWECVLVGHRLDMNSDFVFVLNDDPACSVYTYSQQGEEMLFSRAGKNWGYHSDLPHYHHTVLQAKVMQRAGPAWEEAAAELAEYYSKYDKDGCPL